jgi:hypothetical protein
MNKLAEFLDACSREVETSLPVAANAIDMAALDCVDLVRVAEVLAGLAGGLDREGLVAEANAVDSVLVRLAEKSDFYFVQPEKDKKKPTPPDRASLGPLGHGLSTRYSPDLLGVSMERVSDGVYRDPITNKQYDFNRGFVLDDGTQYPGGSISAQTPGGKDIFQPHPTALPTR